MQSVSLKNKLLLLFFNYVVWMMLICLITDGVLYYKHLWAQESYFQILGTFLFLLATKRWTICYFQNHHFMWELLVRICYLVQNSNKIPCGNIVVVKIDASMYHVKVFLGGNSRKRILLMVHFHYFISLLTQNV